MPTGTVKAFNDAKGFGFIVPDRGSGLTKDLFAHFSAIEPGIRKGRRTLVAGTRVEFEVENTAKGLQAKNIRDLGPAQRVLPDAA